MSVPRLFVSGDAAGRSVGADATAAAFRAACDARGLRVSMVRPGSRGLCWLEPWVELEHDRRRYAFGPVQAGDVAGLLDAGLLEGRLLRAGSHALALGAIDELPWMQRQTRLTFARVGVIDPLSLDHYRAHDGGLGLEHALTMTPTAIVEAVTASGLRGRGGAAFPTGVKWQTVLAQPSGPKYIACNADEGDSGTFADRMLMEGDPFSLIEGMVIAGLAVGATQGYIYLRIEYPHARATLDAAIATAYAGGLLGALPGGRRFDLEVRLGAGAYICGEETSMLESLEGKRGEVRSRPPLPAVSGLFGQPTVVNNVLSLATVPGILAHGAEAYQALGTGRSRGTLAVQLGGNVRRGGLFEVPFGMPLRALIEDIGGGTASGRPVRAVQVGGPLGAFLPIAQLDTPLDYEAFTAIGALLGHGGVVVFDDTVDMAAMAARALRFCADESCGKCTPCRIGSTRGAEALARLRAGEAPEHQLALVEELCHTLQYGSLCGLGGLTPYPVRSAITYFRDDFLVARGTEER